MNEYRKHKKESISQRSDVSQFVNKPGNPREFLGPPCTHSILSAPSYDAHSSHATYGPLRPACVRLFPLSHTTVAPHAFSYSRHTKNSCSECDARKWVTPFFFCRSDSWGGEEWAWVGLYSGMVWGIVGVYSTTQHHTKQITLYLNFKNNY